MCSYGFNWQQVIIVSGEGLVPYREHAFTWTNDDHVKWCIYASPDLNELTHCPPWGIWLKFQISNFQDELVIDGWSISCDIALKWLLQDLTDD